MAASYPGAIKTFSSVVNGVTKLVAALFNSPYDEITAIETELGTDVAGTAADLKTRLAVFLNNDGTSKVDVDDYGTSLSAPTAKTLENVKIQYGIAPAIANGGTAVITGLPFTSATSYTVFLGRMNVDTSNRDVGSYLRDSASQFTITNSSGETSDLSWLAIGT